jgi:hypothetical protein
MTGNEVRRNIKVRRSWGKGLGGKIQLAFVSRDSFKKQNGDMTKELLLW